MEGATSTTSKPSADSLSTATKLVASPLPQAIGSASFTAPGASVYCVVHGPQSAGSDDREFTDQGKFSVAVYLAPFARQGQAEAARRRQGDDSREEEEELAARVKEALLPSLRLECLKKSVLAVHLEVRSQDASPSLGHPHTPPLYACAFSSSHPFPSPPPLAQILRDSGTAFCACVTCASLALADSGLEVRDEFLLCFPRSSSLVLVLVCLDDGAFFTGRCFFLRFVMQVPSSLPHFSHLIILPSHFSSTTAKRPCGVADRRDRPVR